MEPVKELLGHASARIVFIFMSLFLGLQSWASAQGVDVEVNTDKGGGGAWYTSWWVWAAAALFILALVAIVSAGRRHS